MTDIINEEENLNQTPEEIEDVAVVDNGTTYESTESAIIAKEEADRAKLWAQESERQAGLASGSADTAAQARDDAIAAKEYAEAAVTDANVVAVGTDLRSTPSNIKTVASNITDVTTVAGVSSAVTTVAGVSAGVTTVAGISSAVTTVASNATNVSTVAGVSSDVTTVAGISSDVTSVAGNATDISAVAANNTNITAVAGNATNINAVNANKTNIDKVASDINRVNLVADDIASVHTVAVDISTVIDVANNKTNIDAVAGNNANITAVAGNSTNINAVNANKTNIDAVAANNTNITAVAGDLTNINAVAADLTNIDNASANAQLAKDWAKKMDGMVAGEDYSAKYYANQARQAASSAVDNKTIILNANNQHQAIGVINQNTADAVKIWSGTKEEYEDITHSNDTVYLVVGVGIYIGDIQVSAGGGGGEIGDIGIAPLGIDEAENKRRYLNGQVISQAQFVTFTNKLKAVVATYPNLATSEVNWQAEVTNSALGQCGKFVIDDVAGTIKLPKVVNINGLQNLAYLGAMKEAGLPNITGKFTLGSAGQNTSIVGHWQGDGAFSSEDVGGGVAVSGSGSSATQRRGTFDASSSSSIYGNSSTVQQEAVQYPYFIQVAEGVETSVDVSREIELNNPFSLLDYKYSEYELSNASWLLSNGQWNSGAVYQSVYNLLLQIYNGTTTKAGVSVKLSTEVYADTDFVLNTGDTTFRLPIYTQRVLVKKYVNGTDWYNLYSDGWCEQGGQIIGTTSGTLIFLKPYQDTNYTIFMHGVGTYTGSVSGNGLFNPKTRTASSCTYHQDSNVNIIMWQACGYAVVPTSSDFTEVEGLYFYVGETIQDANIIAASNALTDIANLKNATNFSATGKETVVGWSVPDYTSGISMTSPYTAPSNGFLIYIEVMNGGTSSISINGIQLLYVQSGGAWFSNEGCYPVKKGDVITFDGTCKFYPASN